MSRALTICTLFLVGFLATSCGDLLATNQADAVVKIEADDQPAVLQTRQEILASAGTWGGTRVGEETTQPNETALEFSLPGENLEIALGALGRLDARVVATEIDVDAQQIDRAQTPAESTGTATAPDPADSKVRLRVEVTQAASVGALTPPREMLPRSSSLPVVSTLTVGLAAPTKVVTSIGRSAFSP